MPRPVRLIRNEFEFQDLVDSLERAPELVVRDFALMVVTAELVDTHGDALRAVAPDAPDYETARSLVLAALPGFLP